MSAITGLAGLTSFAVTPLLGQLARRWGFLDEPDRRRKLHRQAIPLAGGPAVLLGLAVGWLAFLAGGPWTAGPISDVSTSRTAALLAAALVIATVGLWDDWGGLRGRQKLAGQLLAAAILLAGGFTVERIAVFGYEWQLGILGVPISLCCLLGAMNALNLLDGADGLATGVGIVLSLSLAALALLGGQANGAFLPLLLAGGLLGFLVYNLPPASAFLGDAGSLTIGLWLGAVSLRSTGGASEAGAVTPLLALWAIPVWDVAMAILRRKLTGRSLYTTDRGHLHHMLQNRGCSDRLTVGIVISLCAATSTAALASVAWGRPLLALAGAATVVGLLAVCRCFGAVECRLLARWLRDFLASLWPSGREQQRMPSPVCTRLQGHRRWDALWETVTQLAEEFDLSSVQLNVHLPALQEDYHVNWQRKEQPAPSEGWCTDIPLVSQNVTVGRLRLTGTRAVGSCSVWMEELVAALRPLEAQMHGLVTAGPVGETERTQHETPRRAMGASAGEVTVSET